MLVIENHLYVTRSGKKGDSSRSDNHGGDSNKCGRSRARTTVKGATVWALDEKQVRPPKEQQSEPSSGHRTVPRWDCSLVSPWKHLKENWRAQKWSTGRKTSRGRRGHGTTLSTMIGQKPYFKKCFIHNVPHNFRNVATFGWQCRSQASIAQVNGNVVLPIR